jgi:FkbM family methyltransferase
VAEAPSAYLSQFGQDQFLDQQLFCGAENLFFVEIGSADPVQINNTFFLESQRGWRGLLIEARPSACELLRSQRSSEVINACVADQAGRSIFLDYGYLAGLCKFMGPSEHAYIEQYNAHETDVRAHWVDTVPLADLLRLRAIETVHLLAVDVEGAELAILSSLDFAAVRVEVILVECNTAAVANDVHHFLLERGYRFLRRIGVDRLFVHPQSPWLPDGEKEWASEGT